MKKALFFLLITTLLASCSSTKQFKKYITPYVENPPETRYSNYATISLDSLPTHIASVSTAKTKSLFVPAILFWYWDYRLLGEIEPQLLGQYFQEVFIEVADSLYFNEKLDGRKIEMDLIKIPNSFELREHGNAIILLIAYSVSSGIYIEQKPQELVFNYRIMNQGVLEKKGTIAIECPDFYVTDSYGSRKSVTQKFMPVFLDELKKSALKSVEELFIDF